VIIDGRVGSVDGDETVVLAVATHDDQPRVVQHGAQGPRVEDTGGIDDPGSVAGAVAPLERLVGRPCLTT
jgi:hypothetical protein